jgi:guanidinopropionase
VGGQPPDPPGSSHSGIKPFDICNVADLGDSPINPRVLTHSIELIQAFFDEVHRAGIRPIAIGGVHTIPLPILRAIAKDTPVGMLHFDAHPDTLDGLCGTKIDHTTFLRRDMKRDSSGPKTSFRLDYVPSV